MMDENGNYPCPDVLADERRLNIPEIATTLIPSLALKRSRHLWNQQ